MGLWDKVKALFRGPSAADVPAGGAADLPGAPGSASSSSTPFSSSNGASAPGAADPWSLGELVSLSPAELEVEAQRNAWGARFSAWRFRRDVIPPLADRTTALFDRAIVLRGLATDEELKALHAIGDEWLVHQESAQVARLVGDAGGEAAVQALRAEKARKKAERQKLAAEKRVERRRAVDERRRTDIVFCGRGVSRGLADRARPPGLLEVKGLPVLETPAALAAALGLSVSSLRGLCFHSEAAARVHYVQFDVPKKTGGVRRLAAPLPRLAAAQRFVLEQILEPATRCPGRLHDAAHGFVAGRSTVTNATPHARHGVVVNFDLEDFFPTLTFPRVKGVYEALGYSPCLATLLALLTTECPRVVVEHGGQRLHVAVGERALPQGACTSPMLSNLACRRLDQRLKGIASSNGLTYTRYADDLTFSAPSLSSRKLGHLCGTVEEIVKAEGFRLHAKKTRVMRTGARQEVTGIVVNAGPRVPREEVRRLRAILHDARRFGLTEANRENRPEFASWLRGKLAYLAMVEPLRGEAMLEELDEIERTGGRGP